MVIAQCTSHNAAKGSTMSIRPRRMAGFAIESVVSSQKLTSEQVFGRLVLVLMHHKDWCMKIIFKKHAFTLVTNTQQKT
jgi:hypothetical protein